MDSVYQNRLTDFVKRARPLLVNVAAGTCRVIALAVGWKIETGTTTRFMQHSTGFQLDSAGNARGTAGVDLQQDRDNDTEVASGNYSFIGSGRENTASGANAGTVGGYTNTASGESSGILGGSDALASGLGAAIIGGYNNTAGENTSAAMGGGAVTNNRFQMAHGHKLATDGDAQVSRFPLSTQITHGDATWYALDLSDEDGVVVPADTAMTFRALVTGITQGAAKSFSFEIVGHIENDGGTTTLKASTVTTIDDSDDTSFDCRAQANDADDTLEIQVHDADGASDSVKWCARVVTAEVTYAA